MNILFKPYSELTEREKKIYWWCVSSGLLVGIFIGLLLVAPTASAEKHSNAPTSSYPAEPTWPAPSTYPKKPTWSPPLWGTWGSQ